MKVKIDSDVRLQLEWLSERTQLSKEELIRRAIRRLVPIVVEQEEALYKESMKRWEDHLWQSEYHGG